MDDTENVEPHANSDDGQHNLDPARYAALTTLVTELARTMNAHNLTRIALKSADLRITLDAAASELRIGAASVSRPVLETDQAAGAQANEQVPGHVITAPMIGTFYNAPAPNEPPFVGVGDQIEDGQTIGIIEAMKIMNEIAADCSGEIIEIVAGNGETVEYGSPLIIVAPFET